MPRRDRPRVALLGPLPPEPSGVSDYLEELLPHLAERFELELFSGFPDPPAPRTDLPVRPYLELPLVERHRPFDLRIYQLGNSICHHPLFALLSLHPGIAVLHETSLHGVRAFGLLGDGMASEYIREAAYCHGQPGRRMARLVAQGYGSPLLFQRLPMLRVVLEAAEGILVHGEHAARQIEELAPSLPSRIAPMPFAPPAQFPLGASREQARERLGIPRQAFVVSTFGLITHAKGVLELIRAIHLLRSDAPEVVLHVVGRPMEGFDPSGEVRHWGLGERVRILGEVSLEDFHWHILASDLCFNLRHPTMGETSATLIRIMGMGRPVVVPDYRQFREEPTETVFRLPLAREMAGAIRDLIQRLRNRPDRLRAVGQAARDLVVRRNRPELAADAYQSLAEEVLASPRRSPLSRRIPLPHLRVPVDRTYRRSVEFLRSSGVASADQAAAQRVWRAFEDLGILPSLAETSTPDA